MNYIYKYKTPDGFSDMIMNSDGEYLTALCFEGSRDISKLCFEGLETGLPVFEKTAKWLDAYFSGKVPDFTPQYRVPGITPFRECVYDIMKDIPYGKTVTYGYIASLIAAEKGIGRMSSQAVGGAVGSNPICIIIPCHRVVGTDKSLTGYGGGIANKYELLKLEGHDMTEFTVPKRGTAL